MLKEVNPMVDIIADQLRIERHAQRLTLEELANRSGVSVKHICNIENKKTKPTLEILGKLAEAMDVQINVHLSKGSSQRTNDKPKAVGE
jgi:transcriptional regulator with XRE-family HTH domain